MLTISALGIGFCLSLYLQSGQQTSSVNWDQYKSLSYNEERSHSLQDFDAKISPIKLEELIREVTEKNRFAGEKTRVMEIGTGNGRVLMTLKALFPDVEFYGINKEKTRTFYRRESYILTALKFDLMSKAELEGTDLPYIVFQDLDMGRRIPYGDGKFDIIFSQSTMAHIKYKFELWNEIMRVLRPGGVSIHSDVSNLNIYRGGVLISLRDAISEIRRTGVDIKNLDMPGTLMFKKTSSEKFTFPVTPHQPLPENPDNIPDELKRPEMSYNLTF